MRRVAIEDSLQSVRDYLKGQGLTVESLESNRQNLNSFDALVVSGQNSNFLGMQDTSTNGSVISAKGLTPQDIYNQIENKMK